MLHNASPAADLPTTISLKVKQGKKGHAPKVNYKEKVLGAQFKVGKSRGATS